MTPRSKLFWIANFVLAFIFISAVVFAWNNPPGNPPTGSGSIATDASNNVGVGEATPVARLHVKTGAAVGGTGTICNSGAPNCATSGTTVTGVGTSFLTQLKVGDSIIAAGQTRIVKTITSATSLTTNSAFSPVIGATSPGVAFDYQRAIGSFNDSAGAQTLWVGATGQAGLGAFPGNAGKLAIGSDATRRFPLYATMDDGRAFGINFSGTSGFTDSVVLGAYTAGHRLWLAAGGTGYLQISPSGKIGLGLDAASLDTVSARVALFDPLYTTAPSSAATILLLGSADGTASTYSLRARGKLAAGATTVDLADLAEYVRVSGGAANYERGDILEINIDNPDSFRKSSGAYAKKIVGAISSDPGVSLGENEANVDSNGKSKTHVQMALAGRVPVKVVGPVAIGDAITSSNLPGIGMAATKSGRIIGFALEPYSGEGIGYVKILINPHYWIQE